MTLTWLGNAGWVIEHGRTVVVVDPYFTMFRDQRASHAASSHGDHEDPIMVADEALIKAHIPRADFILATHSHSDHMSRNENHDYAGGLMRALGGPPIVLPTHWDFCATKTDAQARQEAARFAAEISAASPNTKVIVPDYFSPIRIP